MRAQAGFQGSPAMTELTKLGRYQLKRVLGKGAMGVVYEGHDPTLNRHVAVKTILKSIAIDAETAAAYSARFVREAQAVARLNHPHIVQVHDFGEQDEVAYLVMEFIEGRELRAYFESGESFVLAEAVRIMGELLEALDFAHERGVIHRDVKPANVMLDAQRRAKLADFGVARIQDSDRSFAGTMVGTPAFMSPEQIQGGKVDARTDIFSAGTILYQLLTGEQPFKGAGAWTVAKQIVEVDPAPPSTLKVSVSPALDAVVQRALAKEPSQRFGKAREFAAALRAALAGAQGPASVPSPKSKPKDDARATEAEVEFWRSIQGSNDPAEFEVYLQEFPQGTYAALARIKLAKLREPLEAARKAAEERERAEAEARAKREAEERARREAEEKAGREAAERARRAAEEKARLEAAARAKREAEEKARREAAAIAKRDAEEKARRESEEKVRQAQALARRKQQEEAASRVMPATDNDATVVVERKQSLAVPVVAAAVVIAGAIGAYLALGRKPAPVAEAPAPAKAEAPSPAPAAPPRPEITQADIEKIRKETEERIRREYADKSAAEQAVLAKAAAEKAAQEKLAAMKAAAAEKAAAEKAAAEKAAMEKQIAAAKSASERAALEKAAAEKAAAEKAAAEKAAAERAAAEKAAAEKAAAEKAAAEKAAAAAKPGWPSVGDRWVYEVRELERPDLKTQVTVEVQSAGASGIRDITRVQGGEAIAWTHTSPPQLVGLAPGLASFAPYLRAFQELKPGDRWASVGLVRLWDCDSRMICDASARAVGLEKVSVKAGTFDAWRIAIDLHVRGQQGSGVAPITVWYAESVRRVVRYQFRQNIIVATGGQGWTQPNVDMELVSYSVAGAGAARTAAESPRIEKAPENAPQKTAAGSAGAQLERFIQRVGRDKVLSAEPPKVPGGMRHGEVVYVNDGSCPPGRIREVTGGPAPAGGSSYVVGPRTSRCIPLE
jgi:serine/threonine-protein kinase